MAAPIIYSFDKIIYNPEDSCNNPSGVFGTIIGDNFTDCGAPIVYIDGNIVEIISYTNTKIVIKMPELEFGNHTLTVESCDEFVDIEFIIYGSTTGLVKPFIYLVYDTDGALGKFGRIMNFNINPSMEYVQVRLKYNFNFDWVTGGETTLSGVELLDGDLVYLSNQSVSSENGIYIVRTGTWDFDKVVDSDVFVDLGARARDDIDGDLTREIITYAPTLDFSTVGFYTINYYVVNSAGILSKTIRKVKVLEEGASIVPTDTYKITDYQIRAEFDRSLVSDYIDPYFVNDYISNYVTDYINYINYIAEYINS